MMLTNSEINDFKEIISEGIRRGISEGIRDGLGHEICMGIRYGIFGTNIGDNHSLVQDLEGLNDIADAINNLAQAIRETKKED